MPRFSRLHLAWTFALLAAGLLVLALTWQVPMMLWDHLDLVPIYLAWQEGTLVQSEFWQVHGGHLHSAAYAVLLLTTYGSDGRPWLDVLVSWALLVVYAICMLWLIRRSLTEAGIAEGRRTIWAIMLLFALYPGHLSNLQWGWQVAVFLCLCGTVAAVALLAAGSLNWSRNIGALALAALAYLSFAHGMALLPTAILMIMLHRELGWRRRLAFALPWLLLAAWITLRIPHAEALADDSQIRISQLVLYVLNYLGAGVSRYATHVAPWLAGISLLLLISILRPLIHYRPALPWLGLVAFSIGGAILVAAARAAPYGTEHAFATRYVSFSSIYWLSWLMLVFLSRHLRLPATTISTTSATGRRFAPLVSPLPAISSRPGDPGNASRQRLGVLVTILVASASFNALHMMKQAHRVGQRTHAIAGQIRADFPALPESLLSEIYFEQPEQAQQRLAQLQRLGFAPFSAASKAGHAHSLLDPAIGNLDPRIDTGHACSHDGARGAGIAR